MNRAIDKVVRRERGIDRIRQKPIGGHGHQRHGDLAHESCRDDRLAIEIFHANDTGVIHAGDFRGIGFEIGQIGHIDRRSVGVVGDHEQRLIGPLAISPLWRIGRNAHQRRIARQAVGHALLDPFGDEIICRRSAFESFAAAMLNGHGWLFQQQAFFRIGGKNATAAIPLYDGAIVAPGVVGENRKLKSVLPLGLGMATPRVASRPAQHRQQIVRETNSISGRRVHRHLGHGGFAVKRRGDFSISGARPRIMPLASTSATAG